MTVLLPAHIKNKSNEVIPGGAVVVPRTVVRVSFVRYTALDDWGL